MVEVDTTYRLQRKLSLMKARSVITSRTAPVFKGSGAGRRDPFIGLESQYSVKLLEAIEGALLGDGGLQLQYSGERCYFVINQSPKHLGSLWEPWHILKELEPGLREPYLAGPSQARVVTSVHPLFVWFFKRWYRLGTTYTGGRPKRGQQRKVIPEDIVITPNVMFWEYLWDGSLEENRGCYDIRLSACSFEQSELEFLAERIYEESGIPFKVRWIKHKKTGRSYPQLDLFGGTTNALNFLGYIRLSGCAVPECFMYKFKAVDLKEQIPSW